MIIRFGEIPPRARDGRTEVCRIRQANMLMNTMETVRSFLISSLLCQSAVCFTCRITSTVSR